MQPRAALSLLLLLLLARTGVGHSGRYVELVRSSTLALLVDVTVGAPAGRRERVRVLVDTGSVATWGCVPRAVPCTRAGADERLVYADGTVVETRVCATALTIGDLTVRGVRLGVVRVCEPPSRERDARGILGLSPAAGGLHERLNTSLTLCTRAPRTPRAARQYRLHLDMGSGRCPSSPARAIAPAARPTPPVLGSDVSWTLPVLSGSDGHRPRHWTLALRGARLEVWTLAAWEPRDSPLALNESAATVGPRLASVVALALPEQSTAQLDTGATHIFAPADAVAAIGRFALTSTLRLLLDFAVIVGDEERVRTHAVNLNDCGRTGWRHRLECFASKIAIHPSSQRSSPAASGCYRACLRGSAAGLDAQRWVLGMPFFDGLRGVVFPADAAAVILLPL
jgi:hypothetical protein